MFYPGEGDGPLFAALAEPQQEGPRTLVTQHSLLPLLTDKAHDGTTHRENNTLLLKSKTQTSTSVSSRTHHSRETAGVS